MGKIHTRVKRKMNLKSTRFRHKTVFTRVIPKKGPKSFMTKEAADAWAKEHSVSKEYVLHFTGSKYQWRLKPRT